MRSGPGLIPWASRAAGAIGVGTGVLYLVLIIAQGDTSQLPVAMVWFALMAAAGLAAWFADRVDVGTGRRMLWGAFGVLFVVGVLSIFTIGVLHLIGATLAAFSLAAGTRATAGSENDEGEVGREIG